MLIEEDDNGRKHNTCAFNTETAEQLNAWLNGMRQMTDTNFDIFMHTLLLLFGEAVEERIQVQEEESVAGEVEVD